MAIRERLSGNEAISYAIKQVNPDVMPALPLITCICSGLTSFTFSWSDIPLASAIFLCEKNPTFFSLNLLIFDYLKQ